MANKRILSPEARRRISEAAKRRWALYRSGKPTGMRRVGRPPKSATVAANPYMNMTIGQLLNAKRQLDEAWGMAKKMLR